MWPIGSERHIPDGVPEHIAKVYKRASRLLDYDNVACAAFARTCLEKILDDKGIPKFRDIRNLEKRIERFVADVPMNSALRENVDSIRKMGNFIHLNETVFTGEFDDIDSGQATYVLDILNDLFEELHARPKQQADRRRQLEEMGRTTPPASS
ncbi:MAG: DUF4145 domain-containing protein [Chloroflexi bacterium]|nr:DUF4145 domain-containing protein [Chloroflexota bacterium]